MKRIAYLLAILSLTAFSAALIACGGDDDDGGDSAGDGGDSAAALEDNPDSDGNEGLDLPNDDIEEQLEDIVGEDGDIDVEDLPFGRASDEAYAVATEACAQWAVWDVDEGQSRLDEILALATDALETDEVRDPVLVRLEADLSSLMLALQRGDGASVIDLASSSVDLDCQAI